MPYKKQSIFERWRMRCLYRDALDASGIGFTVSDMNGRLIDANPAFLELLGYTEAELKAGKLQDRILTSLDYELQDAWIIERLLQSKSCPPIEKEYLHKNGSRVSVIATMTIKKPENYVITYLMDDAERQQTLQDIQTTQRRLEIMVRERTQKLWRANHVLCQEIERRKKAEEALRHIAFLDPLTDLYNRRGFLFFAGQLVKLARRQNACLWIFVADVDFLKRVNDLEGHPAGDRLLKHVAQVLRETFRDSDVIARIGGDEFAIAALQESHQPLSSFVHRLKEQVDVYNHTHHPRFPMSLSIGSAKSAMQETGLSLNSLLHEADKELYDCKRIHHQAQ